MTVWVGVAVGLVIGWIAEWIVDWVYWRRGIKAFYANEASLLEKVESTRTEADAAHAEAEGLRGELLTLTKLSSEQEQQLSALRAERESLSRTLEDTRGEIVVAAAASRVALDQKGSEVDAARLEAEGLRNEVLTLTNSTRDQEQQLAALRAELGDARAEIELNAEASLADLEQKSSEAKALRNEVLTLTQLTQEQEQQLSALREEREALTRSADDARGEIVLAAAASRMALEHKGREAEAAVTEAEALRNEVLTLTQLTQEQEQQLSALREEREALTRSTDDARGEIVLAAAASRMALEHKGREAEAAVTEAEALRNEVLTLTQLTQEQEQQLSALREEREALTRSTDDARGEIVLAAAASRMALEHKGREAEAAVTEAEALRNEVLTLTQLTQEQEQQLSALREEREALTRSTDDARGEIVLAAAASRMALEHKGREAEAAVTEAEALRNEVFTLTQLTQEQEQQLSTLREEREALALTLDEARAEIASAAEANRDDLEQIDGIGPVFEQRLFAAGIRTFVELGSTSPARLREIVKPENWQAVDFDYWIEQARGFAKLKVVDLLPYRLEEINGIGPVYVRLLNQAGIQTFGQLADSNEKQLREIIQPKPWQKVDFGRWIRQARALDRLLAGDRPPHPLEKIIGIGPIIAIRLDLAGVHDISDLAEMSVESLSETLGAKTSSSARLANWIAQAQQMSGSERGNTVVSDDAMSDEGVSNGESNEDGNA